MPAKKPVFGKRVSNAATNKTSSNDVKKPRKSKSGDGQSSGQSFLHQFFLITGLAVVTVVIGGWWFVGFDSGPGYRLRPKVITNKELPTFNEVMLKTTGRKVTPENLAKLESNNLKSKINRINEMLDRVRERECGPSERHELAYSFVSYLYGSAKHRRIKTNVDIKDYDPLVSILATQALKEGFLTVTELPALIRKTIDESRYSGISNTAKRYLKCQIRNSFDEVIKAYSTSQRHRCAQRSGSALWQQIDSYFETRKIFATNNVKIVDMQGHDKMLKIIKYAKEKCPKKPIRGLGALPRPVRP